MSAEGHSIGLATRPMLATGLGAILAITGLVYYVLVPIESGDAHWWFIPWLEHIMENGPVSSLAISMPVLVPEAHGSGNYTPPYLYLLILGTAANSVLEPLAIIKLVAIAGTLVCSGCLYYLLRGFVSRETALVGAVGILLVPTVALNSAAWGQIDAIYSGLVVVTIAQALRRKYINMMLTFGAALSFKLQAMFVGPFVLYVLIAERVPIWTLLLPVLSYAVFMMPAWAAGRPARELALIYLDQSHAYPWLSMNAPNPWTFIQYLGLVSQPVGLMIGLSLGAVFGCALASIYIARRLDGVDLLLLALASVTAMPYILPKMTERYFFMADVLSYALAIIKPQRWTLMVALVIQLGSLGAYGTYFLGYRIGTGLGVLAMGCALMIIVYKLLFVALGDVGKLVEARFFRWS